jgi:hypothetical protein
MVKFNYLVITVLYPYIENLLLLLKLDWFASTLLSVTKRPSQVLSIPQKLRILLERSHGPAQID